MNRCRRHSSKTKRRGAVLAATLVCLLVVMLLAAGLLRTITLRQRQIKREHQHVQAIWLAQSATSRAVASLKKSSDYTGETWQVKAEQLAGNRPGVAKIIVEAIPDLPSRRRVRVEVRYGHGAGNVIRENKELIVHLPEKGEKP